MKKDDLMMKAERLQTQFNRIKAEIDVLEQEERIINRRREIRTVKKQKMVSKTIRKTRLKELNYKKKHMICGSTPSHSSTQSLSNKFSLLYQSSSGSTPSTSSQDLSSSFSTDEVMEEI